MSELFKFTTGKVILTLLFLMLVFISFLYHAGEVNPPLIIGWYAALPLYFTFNPLLSWPFSVIPFLIITLLYAYISSIIITTIYNKIRKVIRK